MTVKKMKMVGAITIIGTRRSSGLPAARMLPQDGVGSLTPKPRKARPASATMATPIASRVIAIMAGTTLGSTSRNNTRHGLAPIARAAMTKSRSAHASVLARVIRASSGMAMMPNAAINTTIRLATESWGPLAKTETNSSANTSCGKASNALNVGDSTASVLPRK